MNSPKAFQSPYNPMAKMNPLEASPLQTTSPDILQIQASTNLGIAQANEARHRQLLGQERILQWLYQQLDARANDLQHREDQLALREQEVARQKQAADANLEEARAQKDRALADRDKADEFRNNAEMHLSKAEGLRKTMESEIAEAKAAQDNAEKELKQSEISFAWPQSLEGENWRIWRQCLRAQAEADWRVTLLLARLQVLSSLLRSPENEKPVLEALAALGLAVCALDMQKAMELALALSHGSQGVFDLSLPRINDNVDRVWMKGPPNTTKVTRVIGWCVRDKLGAVQFPAQVE